MTNTKVKNVVAGSVVILAWIYVCFAVVGLPPSVNRKPHQGLGQVLAEQVAQLRGPGGKVTVITRDISTYPNPALATQMKSFQQALKKAGVSIAATKVVGANPITLVTAAPGDFFNAMKNQTEADVLVSFIGPAAVPETQLAKLGEKRPKVVALCTGTMPQRINLKQLFEQKLLHAAVVSRDSPLASGPSSNTPGGWFDHLYRLVTPANLAEALPDARP
jgi:hypothetical protein